jgi:hypothetical protein
MFKQSCAILILALVLNGAATGQEKATIEVYFATEHVSESLKAGAQVDLKRVSGKTVTPNGKVTYSTDTLASNIEVASITIVEKPKSPEQAVKVELRVTKDQAAKIERAKTQLVTTMETAADGRVESKKKPITFRLEQTKVTRQ